jgi:acyl-CoA thioester hydrolase
MATWIDTGRAVAHPWLCDQMGHLNSRYYAAIFDDASFHFLGRIAPRAEQAAARRGWADVRVTIEFRHEVALGAVLAVRSCLVKLGTKSVTYRQELRDAETGELHATAEAVTVLFDLERRVAIAIDGEARARAQALLGEAP